MKEFLVKNKDSVKHEHANKVHATTTKVKNVKKKKKTYIT